MASITQRGPNSWRVLVRRKGAPTVCRTFRTEREAREFARSAERAQAAGKPVERGITIGQCIATFREIRAARRPISPGSTEFYMLRNLEAELGALLVDKATPQRLAAYCRQRADDGAGPVTCDMEMSKLGTVIRHAATWLHVVLPDVVAQARPMLRYAGLIGPGQHRDRRTSDAELAAICAHLSPTMQDVVWFAVASAMRRGEIVRVRWADLDAERRCVLIRDRKHPRAKAGNHQLVPLTRHTGHDAWAIVQRQPRIAERIFPLSPETVSDEFLAACRVAGVEDLHFHDLRHECTSRLFEAGLSIQQVAVITGHQDWRHLKRYTHIKPESLTAQPVADIRPGIRPRPGNLPTFRRRRDKSAQ